MDVSSEKPRPGASALRLTPREWREILEDPSFLSRPDNRYQRPRRYLGLPIEIVPEGWQPRP